jgi:hypothetical protein
MSITVGKHVLGPGSGTLSVRTKKGGAASMAGHNLLIEVTDWSATLEVGEQTAIELSANPGSLRVLEGSGGVQSLGDDDKAGITQTIDEEVLKRAPIVFRSTSVEPGGDGKLAVSGELELGGARHPIAFALSLGSDGHLTGAATLKQSDWGIKPYSALFGTLKVLDEVQVEIDAELPAG